MNEYPSTSRDMREPMHHLVSRDVIQHETDGFGRINTIWNRSEFALWQADVLRVAAMNRQGGDDLIDLGLLHPFSRLLHDTNDAPARREWEGCLLRVNALPHQQVGE